MAVGIKVDEDLPGQIATLLGVAGNDAKTVVEQGHTGAADDELWLLIQQEGRVLFTADKGFADARRYPPGTHAGVVLFRLPRESRAGYIQLANFLVSQMSIDAIAGAIVTVSPDAIRIHR
jgi:predicted nuclease of predicted toxin-antitoxin system